MDLFVTAMQMLGSQGIIGLFILLDAVALYLLFLVYGDSQKARKRLHERINELKEEHNTHERICGERWGEVKTKLEQLNECWKRHD